MINCQVVLLKKKLILMTRVIKNDIFLNILEWAYSLIINNNTRSLNIVTGWSNYYFDFKTYKT